MVFDYGLSDEELNANINIGSSSATLHWVGDANPVGNEYIQLKRLDHIIDTLNLDKIDFIKIDVDGHEPSILKGGWNTINKYKPVILLEISHAHYFKYGVAAWDFYRDLKERGFYIYSEKDLREYKNLDLFLNECGNFAYSANIIISQNVLS